MSDTLTPIAPPPGPHRPPAFSAVHDNPEQEQVNRDSHQFVSDPEGDTRCLWCDCRPWGTWATWGCNV